MPRRLITPPPLIYRYVFKEINTPFWITLFVFTGILFLARSLKLVDLVVNKNVPAGDIILLFSYIVPSFLEIAVPMSLLLGTILGFGRLSSDSELVVIRATGISLKQLARPVVAFAVLALCAGVATSFWLRPWANYQLGLGLFEIAKTQASAGLGAGIFNELGQLTIYAESIDDNGTRLNNVIIGDRRDPNTNRTFIAKYGRIVSDNKRRTVSLKLFDGSIPEGSGLNFNVTYFEINNISLPHSVLTEEGEEREEKRSKEMFIGELLSTIRYLAEADPGNREQQRRRARYEVELHKRIAVPFSCVCVALIAMALGIQPSRGGHTWGASVNVGAGIILILIYYLSFAFASALGEQGAIPPWLVMWIPNAVFFLIGLYLFDKMGSEQWLAVSQEIGERIAALFQRLRLMPAALGSRRGQ